MRAIGFLAVTTVWAVTSVAIAIIVAFNVLHAETPDGVNRAALTVRLAQTLPIILAAVGSLVARRWARRAVDDNGSCGHPATAQRSRAWPTGSLALGGAWFFVVFLVFGR